MWCENGSAHSNPGSSTITLRHQSHNSASYGTSARHFTIVLLPRFCSPSPEPLSGGLRQTAASNFQSMWCPWKAPPVTWATLTFKCIVDTHIEGFGVITTVCVEALRQLASFGAPKIPASAWETYVSSRFLYSACTCCKTVACSAEGCSHEDSPLEAPLQIPFS